MRFKKLFQESDLRGEHISKGMVHHKILGSHGYELKHSKQTPDGKQHHLYYNPNTK